MNLKNMWLGYGVQVNAMYAIGGVEETQASIFCLGDPLEKQRYAYVRGSGASLGLGLGSTWSTVAILCWGFQHSAFINDGGEGIDFQLSVIAGLGGWLKSIQKVGKGGDFFKYAGTVAHLPEQYKKSHYMAEQLLENRDALEKVVRTSPQGVLVLPIYGKGLQAGLMWKASVLQATDSGIINVKRDPELLLTPLSLGAVG